MQFPEYRGRRVRSKEGLRRLVRETRLSCDNLIYPLFVCPGKRQRQPITAMPGQHRLSVDETVAEAEEAFELGVPGIILCGLPNRKDAVGSEAWDDGGVVQQAIRALRKAKPDLVVIADACFCEYTSHGHCGVLRDGEVDNDATLENLARLALSYARAGVDIVAPSGMMDGTVETMREALDEQGFEGVAIMGYSAKYASGYYGPF